MWRIPAPLIAGGGEQILYFTSDTWVGDLWTYMGSPSLAVDVIVTADSCDVGGLYISSNFAAGSTFQCTAVNNGRFIGKGGDGGDGGDDLGSSVTSAGNGTAGGHAISSEGFTINVNVDDGYLLGGGGGGGGGAGADYGATADAGGGGGGGIGFTGQGGVGGSGGTGSVPAASGGTNGTSSAAGPGGLGGGTGLAEPDGGAGGFWGEAGKRGYHDGSGLGRAGVGGLAGNAFAPISGAAAINFNGTLTETQLRSTGQVLGETAGQVILQASRFAFAVAASPTSVNAGWAFQSSGELLMINTTGGGVQNGYHWRDTINVTGSEANWVVGNYEIFREGVTRTGTWDNIANFAEDSWVAFTLSPQVYDTSTTFSSVEQLFMIRRKTTLGGSGEPLAMGFYAANRETFA